MLPHAHYIDITLHTVQKTSKVAGDYTLHKCFSVYTDDQVRNGTTDSIHFNAVATVALCNVQQAGGFPNTGCIVLLSYSIETFKLRFHVLRDSVIILLHLNKTADSTFGF